MSIHRLPDLLVNKIAAGEVVERPASVLKELVENSLDAGATNVQVHLEQCGQALLRVSDDGMGIPPDDLPLAVAPHATSKIRHETDLEAIATLGFRGEALASIAAVAHVAVVSRPRGFDAAGRVTASGQQISPVSPASSPVGTTVEVRDLFYNVPARRKFLRSSQTEAAAVNEQLARLAIPHPQVGFRLTHGKRVVHELSACDDVRQRIRDFFGPELADELIEISRDERGLSLKGWVAPPAQTRATGKWQYTFLNGRYIRDRLLQHAVREAYRGLVMVNRFPVVFLFLGLDPAAVDVNVHPTKIEVRWRNARLVHSQVLVALRETFGHRDLTPPVEPLQEAHPDQEQERIRQQIAELFKQASPVQQRLEFAGPRVVSSSPPIAAPPEAPPLPSETPIPPVRTDRPTPVPSKAEALPDQIAEPGGPIRAMQLHGTYLVTESEDGLIIVDQHALHERILYESLSARVARGPLTSQRLLLPESFAASDSQIAAAENHRALLEQLGFVIEPFGPQTLAVHAYPAVLRPTGLSDFAGDLLDRLAEHAADVRPQTLLLGLVELMACKAAVKAGDPLTPEEIASLLAQRQRVERSSFCPHGRPTTLRMTLRDLEKQFKRI